MNDTLYRATTMIAPIVFAIVFHEVAHGWVARMLGDHTAAERGRLSLNPLRHVDPFGTLMLPGLLALTGLPVFGWAKPVPVDYRRLNNPQRDMALVGAAGPAMNLVLALAAAVVIGLLARATASQPAPGPWVTFLGDNLLNFLLVNLSLAVFNLLPLPPFDGSRILRGLLPAPGVRVLDRIEPIGIPLIFAVFVVLPWLVPGLHLIEGLIGPPMAWLFGLYLKLASLVGGVPLA